MSPRLPKKLRDELRIAGIHCSIWGSWAITYGITPPPGCHPFVGQHYFERGGRTAPWQDGVSVALFTSRASVRRALRIVKRKNKHARIVRVAVGLKWAVLRGEPVSG
jgi:hypothetical protein